MLPIKLSVANLDGTKLQSSYPRNQLTKFHRRSLSDPLTHLEDNLPEILDEPDEVEDMDFHTHTEPAEEPDEASADGEKLHPTYHRRSARILKRYGQDLQPRQRVEIRIPARSSSVKPHEYRNVASGLAKGRPKI